MLMSLSEYLRHHDLTHSQFGAMVGVTSVAITRYVNGGRMPRPAIMRRIEAVTAGAVGPQDFYNKPSEGEAA